VTLVASKVDGCGSLLFWVAPEKHLKSGFTFGNGYKAYANDFPEGTKLTVTASIELPDPTFPKKELAGGADS
jgi:hypothetical protein